MNLIIDVGNSFVKLAIFDSGELLQKKSLEATKTENEIKKIVKKYPKLKKAIISSVGNDNPKLMKFLNEQFLVLSLNHSLALPLKINTKHQKRLE